jgi:endonuclease III
MKNIEDTQQLDELERRQTKYPPVAAALREMYGELEWQLGQSAMDELVSCILSQNTNDNNRDKAFFALKERYPTWMEVIEAPTDEVIDVIRPAGLSNQKAPRIQNVLRLIYEERGEFDIDFLRDLPMEEARAWLTKFDGVGPKTAAIVLCFAFNRPAFPVDTHVHRVSTRLGFIPETTADKAHTLMEDIVPSENRYAFHIHLISHGRAICKARHPLCERCPLTAQCDYHISIEKKRES